MDASWEMEFDGSAPQTIGMVIDGIVEGSLARGLTDNQRAASAWNRANGDWERKHTTGVFLRTARTPGAAPILGVYVDSHAMATDFGVNKDLYLGRLANIGFAVSGIEFRVSRTPRRKQEMSPAPRCPEELPALTSEEQAQVDALVATVPPSLQTSVSKAVANSFRREKSETTITGQSR